MEGAEQGEEVVSSRPAAPPAMALHRLLLGRARRAVLGSAETALCGELGGRWGVRSAYPRLPGKERGGRRGEEGRGSSGWAGALASLDFS